MNNESNESEPKGTGTQKVGNELRGNKISSSPGYLEVLFIAHMVAMASLYGYDHFFADKVVALDIKSYLGEQKALLTAGKITEEQWKAGLDRLEQILHDQPANQMVILKDVVLKNGREITIE